MKKDKMKFRKELEPRILEYLNQIKDKPLFLYNFQYGGLGEHIERLKLYTEPDRYENLIGKYFPSDSEFDELMRYLKKRDIKLGLSWTKGKRSNSFQNLRYSNINTSMDFNGDIVISDPCYFNISRDNPQIPCIQANTIYGDWSCHTLQKLKNGKLKPIGEFCADGGMVGVFHLDDLIKLDEKNTRKYLAKEWVTTIIKNFKGKVKISYNKKLDMVVVDGKGNINFTTRQTGF